MRRPSRWAEPEWAGRLRRQDTAEHGDIVAALVEGEKATVKQLHRRDGEVWLMPRNATYQPIPGEHAQILGKVVGVMRLL
ncbi:LexA family protein [Streptomyces sp. MMBL 11-3]|uniref:LexA family protein n=1 Tax=Streptomyces sp. MMBL 11-3 TaxID=3382639 RepID=UPI0039B6C5EE